MLCDLITIMTVYNTMISLIVLIHSFCSSKKKSHGSKKRSGMSVLKEDDDEEENGGGITIKASAKDNKGFSNVD